MLQKGVFPYEYMDGLEKLNETLITWKGRFLHITGADYAHGKRFCKDFKIKKVRRILWFVYSKHYIVVNWCIWKLSKYASWNIGTWSCAFSYSTRFSMASSFKKGESKIRFFNWYY